MQLVGRAALAFALAANLAVDAQLVVQTASKDDLMSTFLSSAAETLNVITTTIGDPQAMGTFTGGQFGITDGVVLSTGKISTATQGASADPAGTDFPPTGDAGDTTSFALQIQLDEVVPLQFGYVFASRELPEFGGTEFNDKFTMTVNGENRALLTDGKTVTINNLTPSKTERSKDHPDYIGNPQFQYFSYTGYTKPLQLTASTRVGMNTINITVADFGDGQYDSTVFLVGNSLVINTYTYALQSGASTACSVTCGTGVRMASYQCIDGYGSPAPGKCKSAAPAGVATPCTLSACPVQQYTWTTLGWGLCSATCGNGLRTRTVTCTDSFGNAAQCIGAAPASSESCSQGPCLSFSYRCRSSPNTPSLDCSDYSSWGPCSASCGTGSQSRIVQCMDSSNTPASDAMCTAGVFKPPSTQQCTAPMACATYMFVTGSWGGCSATCGTGGMQTRSVDCKDTSTGIIQPDATCQGSSRNPVAKPVDGQPCSGPACATYSWSVAQWGMCSVTCGSGQRSRLVDCRSSQGAIGTDDLCAGGARSPTPKPTQSEPCSMAACPSYQWQSGVWGSCSASCDTCYQSRSVSCLDRTSNAPASDAQCLSGSAGPKPDTQKSTVQSPCRLTCSCTDYCNLMMQHCKAVFPNKDVCMTVCSTYPPGTPDVAQARRDRTVKDTCIRGQNDACCRLNNAKLAATNPERYCPFASHHGGGMCGTYCQGYCNLALPLNPSGAKNGICYSGDGSSRNGWSYEVLDKDIVSMQNCERVCDLYPTTGEPYDAGGNTVHCRTQQLLKAVGSSSSEKQGFCLGGSYHGGDRCGTACEGCAGSTRPVHRPQRQPRGASLAWSVAAGTAIWRSRPAAIPPSRHRMLVAARRAAS